jgi:hypothetical protein
MSHKFTSVKAATPTSQRERRLHPKPSKERFEMIIETIIAGLPVEMRERFERDARRAEHMVGGSHLQEWMDFEVTLHSIRSEAMRAASTNKPQGRGYNEAHAALMHYYKLDQLDKTSVSAVLWLTDPKDKYGPDMLTRKQILDSLLSVMLPHERSKLGSPITARQKVQKRIELLAKSGEDTSDVVTEKPLSKSKQTEQELAVALEKVARLERQVARHDDGSLFDLKHDNVISIVTVIINTVSPNKAKEIASAIMAQLKKKPMPAG